MYRVASTFLFEADLRAAAKRRLNVAGGFNPRNGSRLWMEALKGRLREGGRFDAANPERAMRISRTCSSKHLSVSVRLPIALLGLTTFDFEHVFPGLSPRATASRPLQGLASCRATGTGNRRVYTHRRTRIAPSFTRPDGILARSPSTGHLRATDRSNTFLPARRGPVVGFGPLPYTGRFRRPSKPPHAQWEGY